MKSGLGLLVGLAAAAMIGDIAGEARQIRHPKAVLVGRRMEQTKSGRVREVIRVTEEKLSRWTGAELRTIRAERGVGQRFKITRL